MFDAIWEPVQTLLGIGNQDLNSGEMTARAIVTFVVTVAIIRLGDKRMFGKGTAFDTVVAIMIGSIMSRGITGSSPLIPTWTAGAVLVGLHWLLAYLTFRLDWFGPLVKGNAVHLIEDGEILQSGARRESLTPKDIEQALREQGIQPDISRIKRAVVERDGSISVIPADREPRILDVTVQDGVQTVRIEV